MNDVTVRPGKAETFEFAIVVEETPEAALNNYISVKNKKDAVKNAGSPLGKDLLDVAVVQKILPKILYHKAVAVEREKEEVFPQKKDNLWSFGISGDLPIVLIKIDSVEDAKAAIPYIRASKNMRSCGIESDTVFVYNKPDGYFSEIRTALRKMLSDEKCDFCRN